jgi:hypothetical protein
MKAFLLLLLALLLAGPSWAADDKSGDGTQATATKQGDKGEKQAGDGEEEEPECD